MSIFLDADDFSGSIFDLHPENERIVLMRKGEILFAADPFAAEGFIGFHFCYPGDDTLPPPNRDADPGR